MYSICAAPGFSLDSISKSNLELSIPFRFQRG
jgi:hypothetical protein